MDDLKGIVSLENVKVTLAPKDFSSSEPSKRERREGQEGEKSIIILTTRVDKRVHFWNINTRSTIGPVLEILETVTIKAEAHVPVDPCKIRLTLINYNITYISSSSFLISSSICLRSSVILAPFSSFSSFSLIKIN